MPAPVNYNTLPGKHILQMRNRKFWGWGSTHYQLDQKVVDNMKHLLQVAFGVKQFDVIEPPGLEDLLLRSPRFELPRDFFNYVSAAAYDRALHTYGRSFRDVWRALHGDFSNPPDYVAYPHHEEHLHELMKFASENDVAIVPCGGGSSVVGGIEPTKSEDYAGVITVNMKNFDRVLELDLPSRSAHIQAGIFGPKLEKELKPHGLTLRHFPQSFEYSTLGGWIATRSGGHFATLFTHIDEFVQAVRVISPADVMSTRRFPGSGAGPSEERLICGSEGTLGIITSAWMRLQHIPKFKQTQIVRFPTFDQGVEACRRLAQSSLFPTNARLISPLEAYTNGIGNGQHAVLILGFESAYKPVREDMQNALTLCRQCEGRWHAAELSSKQGAADQWKQSFFQAPYIRDELMRYGFLLETFETAVTWDKFAEFHQAIEATANAAVREHCGAGSVTCRFTHLYPDGPAPYYTVIARSNHQEGLRQWDAIKAAVSQKIIEMGGTITHHHAVGRDHRPYYQQQHSRVFGKLLRAMKKEIDPCWILNPGILLDRPPGQGSAR